MSGLLIFLNIYLFISILVVLYFLSYAVSKKDSMVAQVITLLAFSGFIYLFGYLLELNASDLSHMYFWNFIQYMMLPFFPAFWLMTTFTFSQKKLPHKKLIALLFVIPTITFIMRATNDWHHLYYADTSLYFNGFFNVLFLTKGPWYYVQFTYNFIIFTITTILYIRYLKTCDTSLKTVAKRLIMMSLFPWIGLALILIPPFSQTGIDFSAVFLPFSIIMFGTLITNRHFMTIKPTARNQFFESANQGIVVFDHNNILIDANPYILRLFPELKNHFNQSLIDFFEAYPEFRPIEGIDQIDTVKYKDFYFQTDLTRLYDSFKNFIGTIFTFVDITDNVKALEDIQSKQERIEYLSYHDQLTNLYNRHFLEEYIKKMNDKQHPLAVIYIDLNNLKYVNDKFGHQAGDNILKAIGNIFFNTIRKEDIAIRIGGDEFLILIPNVDQHYVNDFITLLTSKTKNNDSFSFAVGYAIKEVSDHFEHVYQIAEDAMYQNKSQMKNIKSSK